MMPDPDTAVPENIIDVPLMQECQQMFNRNRTYQSSSGIDNGDIGIVILDCQQRSSLRAFIGRNFDRVLSL
jgi:hypothetical protein